MYVQVVHLQAKDGKEKELEDAMKALFPLVEKEEGTLQYVLHQVQGTKGAFLFYERFQDKAAYEAHMTTPYLNEVLQRFGELLSAEPQITACEQIAAITR